MPMTASAACGSPVQQAVLTDTRVVVPSFDSTTKPTSASLRTWCEQVDWLMLSCSVNAPTVVEPAAATACRSRTRVGSARQENHSA